MHVSRLSRGQLRVYLGAAAGVGKTYQMLGDARLAGEEDVDLVIGYLEAHGRRRTEDRAKGLEMAPRLEFGVGGHTAVEPDIGWIIDRRPAIACIDELAHTNAAGAPRRKRYEDVEHLLSHGIEVWTTVNVQHLESLHDRVLALTGIDVRETFPDGLLHGADEIRLIDLSPRALRERIARGLVYPPDRVERALGGFFTAENLASLRAVALHEMAEVAAAEARDGSSSTTIERVLVSIGGRATSSGRLIREGARLARRADAELLVLVVEPQDGRIDDETRAVLASAETLTCSLGGTFLRRAGDDAAGEIVRELEAQRATWLVLGEGRRSGWRSRMRSSTVDRVLRATHGVDVYVVADPGAVADA
ncbi:MAG: two-component system, OmpR family, sensor histidine kinase KdpD [Gaiellales bacterium]|nr:two-component system, OmpR family, sensor histidine kinase KdpD [Gaiellales bacterium]